jgi:putative FmdB family regulatory protein
MFVPNYEYQCNECGNRFELWQSVGEAAPSCPNCGAATKKVFHPPRVIFKGSGFYVTDLRAEKEAKSSAKSGSSTDVPAAAPAAAGSSEPANTGSTETKTENKAASTTEKPLPQPVTSDKK